ncbi:phospholipid scramblase 1-like [Pseudophryne corroboree]|uniref:phospholipid scramblase 1-like n=1 Tax=Pseudophryne corroboree TaxID=495146 RepID=UPI0030814A15
MDTTNSATPQLFTGTAIPQPACRDTPWEILNDMGQQVYSITEDRNCFCEYFLGIKGPLSIHFTDHTGGVVMEVYRPCTCAYCPEKVQVRTPSGVPMAYIAKTFFSKTLKIQNENGADILKMVEPSFCSNTFQITSIAGNYQVGRAVINHSGIPFCPQATIRDIHFPLDLDIKMKAAILSACLFLET